MKWLKRCLSTCWNTPGTGGISAAIYTQWTDVETEVNGLLTYDRALVMNVEDGPP